MPPILEFRGPTRWLSNFHLKPVRFENVTYPSNENAYQAAKTLDLEQRKYLETCTPREAKNAGMRLNLRPDWEEVKSGIMLEINLDKFWTEPERSMLIDTGLNYLMEGNNWGDRYWGVDKTGLNKLGKILMYIRARLICDDAFNLMNDDTTRGNVW